MNPVFCKAHLRALRRRYARRGKEGTRRLVDEMLDRLARVYEERRCHSLDQTVILLLCTAYGWPFSTRPGRSSAPSTRTSIPTTPSERLTASAKSAKPGGPDRRWSAPRACLHEPTSNPNPQLNRQVYSPSLSFTLVSLVPMGLQSSHCPRRRRRRCRQDRLQGHWTAPRNCPPP